MKRKTILAAELSWTEFREHMKTDDVVVIPVGMLEQHGLHNPLGTDTFIAEHCAQRIGETAGAVVAPAFPYGYGPEGRRFPGQVSLQVNLFNKILYAYASSYARHGARRFLFVNGHGGNTAAIRTLGAALYQDFGAICTSTEWWTLLPQLHPEWSCRDHGGYYETSCMLAVNPALVDMRSAKAPPAPVHLTENIAVGHCTSYKGVAMFATLDDYKLQKIGNLGESPIGANGELGTELIDAYVDFNVGLVGELRKIELNG